MLRTRLFASLLAILLSTLPAAAYHEQSEPSDGTVRSFRPVSPPEPIPESLVFKADGTQSVALEDWRGKVILLNLWATWCPPCVRELPALDRLQA
ncbi:MAG: redoxin family protein, partial [Candidatus Competibacterales bacterium]|nr:redoxin family protein [Candidatus Competibacterales bacterium]